MKENWENWWDRKDLLDGVIKTGADFTGWFIHNVKCAKERVLAALFDKGKKGMIDEVLGKVECNDWDLASLTFYRPELAGSPEKFSKVLDKIEEPKMQESAVCWGVGA